jgi:hypothetical protein
MDINRLVELLGALPFRQAVWLFPCLSRGPVDQYAGPGGVLDRCGDPHCGRSHERVWREVSVTPARDLRLESEGTTV